MVAIFLPTDTPSTQGVGSKGQTIYSSESSNVAYQIKADDPGSNMVANVLPTDTPLTQGVGSKGQAISFTESSHVAYQNKGRERSGSVVKCLTRDRRAAGSSVTALWSLSKTHLS